MKPEQAPIEIAKELHELNKKLDTIIDILKFTKGLIPARKLMATEDIAPFQNPHTIGDPCPNPYEITCSSGNPEAHDYGVGYLYNQQMKNVDEYVFGKEEYHAE